LGCYLRVSGVELDVDRFLTEFDVPHCGIHRICEPRLPRTQPNGEQFKTSGLSICVSAADFGDFEKQIADAIESLGADADLICDMRDFTGVDEIVLDFGINWEDCAAQFDRLPAELIRLAGNLGLAIEISHYPMRRQSKDESQSPD